MTEGMPGRKVTRLAKVLADVIWWLAVGAAVLLVVFVLSWPLTTREGLDPSVHVHVAVPDGVGREWMSRTATEPAGSSAALEVADLDGLEGELELRYLEWWVVWVGGLVAVPVLAAGLFGLHLLRSFLEDVQSRDVFTAENAGRLTRLGWLLVTAGVVLPILEFGHTLFLVRQAGLVGTPVGIGIGGFPAVIPGLLVLVMAAAWRYGVELQREHDLTV